MLYLNMNTADVEHQTQPYILKRLKWNDALDLFNIQYDSDTSESDNSTRLVE